MEKLNGLDLFSGIGGISQALAPWVKTVAYCERERYPQAVLLSRMERGEIDTAPIWDDVTSLDKSCLDMILSYQREVISMAGKLKKLTPEQVIEAVKGYDAGMSLQDLAHLYSVSRQSMWDLLTRRTKLRPQKRYGEENHFYRGGKRADAKANDTLERALRTGKFHNPGKCSKCGSAGKFSDGRTEIQAHHPDYNKPLDVMWLCQKCHHEWHKNNKPIPYKEVKTEPASVIDIVTGGFP